MVSLHNMCKECKNGHFIASNGNCLPNIPIVYGWLFKVLVGVLFLVIIGIFFYVVKKEYDII